MSSKTDMEALDASIARLEVMQTIQQGELDDLKQKVADLRVEQQLSTRKPKDPASQPTAPTGSSDPVLRAEISRLQRALATKDAELATKDAELEIVSRKFSDLMKSEMSYEDSLITMAREKRRNREAAGINDLPPEDLMPKIEVTDTDRSGQPASSSPPKDVKGEEAKPKKPSFCPTPTKVPADAAPVPPGTAKPKYSQVLKTPNAGSSFRNMAFPSVARPGGFSGTSASKQQTPSYQPKQKQFVKRQRAPKNREQKGREGQRLERGSTSAPNRATPETAQEITSTNTKAVASAIKSADQPSRKSDIDSSVANSKLQVGPEAPVPDNKDKPSGRRPKLVSCMGDDEPYVLDKEGELWTAWKYEFHSGLGNVVPPEVKAAVESGALPIPTTDAVEDDASVSSIYDTSDAASLKSVDSPAQKLETGNSSLINAFSPNVKKRLADEEQSGAGALLKRLKST